MVTHNDDDLVGCGSICQKNLTDFYITRKKSEEEMR